MRMLYSVPPMFTDDFSVAVSITGKDMDTWINYM